MELALANAAPSDRLQVALVDQAAERTESARRSCDRHSRAWSRNRSQCGGRDGSRLTRDRRLPRSGRVTAQISPRGESSGSGEASASASSRVKPMRSAASRTADSIGSAKRARMKLRALSTASARVLLAERVVIEARQHMALLDRRAETLEEAVLRAVVHHQVRAGNQELGRDGDGARVGDHAIGRLVERRAGC